MDRGQRRQAAETRRPIAGRAIRTDIAGSDSVLVDLIAAGFEASATAVVLFAPDDTLAFASSAFAELYDVQPDARTFADVMRHCHAAGKGPKFSTHIDAWLLLAAAKRRSAPHRAFEIDMADGRWFWASETSYAGGWILLVVTDITVLKSNERMLQMARDAAEIAAGTDSLTGLPNRRQAMAAFAEAIALADKTATPLSLVLIDLDHFKAINDRFGHKAGDDVLCHFAETGKRLLRKSDLLARIGGEEFMLLMPHAARHDALRATERLRMQLSLRPQIEGLDLTYTMSAGIADYAGETPENLFQKADRALYGAKSRGRDCVDVAD
ncbi:GGDEF domain-containing protein [Pararhizobium antarcticum]|uniref:diguanylate cyclase n=1 Tax=Pararhizobium antarcticum TaxID=1798805 RepID=A0A657LNS1_9HYPH|nr:GGDEF domain-containing protein [Pararhizobium antarcticum]OJF92429.1 hypothetical protein AX760_22680 [Pararhizobium antarcticum]OJF99120.1 hypothetical protein AX761_11660 [Rhizobium sp. 58]